jgi:epsilon-lactone hydrolase
VPEGGCAGPQGCPLIEFGIVVVVALALFWAVARFHLRGEDLSRFDGPTGQHFPGGGTPSAEHDAVVASVGRIGTLLQDLPRSQHLPALRQYMDEVFPVGDSNVTFLPVDAGGVRAEWVLAPGADAARRVLYIHGGAFTMGSPKSHRRLTSKFSELTGGAVLAIDYRLMPEHSRMAGVEDCRSAYRWLLENGPQGRGPAAKVWVAGDSAGGNLALSLIAWVRDANLRAPDAAVALSPVTDMTLNSPSLRTNLASDPMIGPMFSRLAKTPRTVLLWLGWVQTRVNPRDPVVSPVYGDLSRLPPVLVQASEAEMLRDDARRYVNRALAAGSPARLQTWDHMVHVWQIFHPELAEGRAALAEIRRFLAAT